MLPFLFQYLKNLLNFPLPKLMTDMWRRNLEREKILEGLDNIRRSMIRLVLTFSVLALLSYSFWKEILSFMQKPLGIQLVYYGIPEAFLVTIKIALFSGIFFSVPFLFRELWISIAPMFIEDFRRHSIAVVGAATLLFYTGVAICYYLLLPSGIQFLVSYQTDHIKPAISVDSYVDFFAAFIFGFGLSFEMPLVMLLLGKAGIVTADFLRRGRRYAVLIITIASAIITPTPDLFNLALMAVPLCALYELSIILVRFFGKL